MLSASAEMLSCEHELQGSEPPLTAESRVAPVAIELFVLPLDSIARSESSSKRMLGVVSLSHTG